MMQGVHGVNLNGYPAARARTAAEPDVLLYSDIDDSLVASGQGEGLAESLEVFSRHDARTVNGYATGRGAKAVETLADKLGPFPMEFIAVNNGQNLYLNPDGLPADEFMRSLSVRQEDPVWAAEVQRRSGGWSIDGVRGAVKDTLTSDGFVAGPTLEPPLDTLATFVKGQLMVAIPADQPAFYVKNPEGSLTDEHIRFGTELRQRVGQRLAEQGVRFTSGEFVHNSEDPVKARHINFYQPVGVTKASLLEHLVSRYPSVHHTITVGDNVNDDMLEPETFGRARNHPVLAGDHHPREEAIEQHPRVERTPSGAIGPGVEAQYQRIGTPPPTVLFETNT